MTTTNPFATKSKDQLMRIRAQYLSDLASPSLAGGARIMVQEELRLVNAAIKELNIAQSRADRSAADRRRALGQKIHVENSACALARAMAKAEAEPNASAAGTCRLVKEKTSGPGKGTSCGAPVVEVLHGVAMCHGHAAEARLANGLPPLGELPAEARTTPSSTPAPQSGQKWPKGIHSLAEFILMRAEQLRGAIRRIKHGRFEYTDHFIATLEAFIVSQREVVDRERTARGLDRDRTRTVMPSPLSDWTETWKND